MGGTFVTFLILGALAVQASAGPAYLSAVRSADIVANPSAVGQKIVGGYATTIDLHPYAAALLWSSNWVTYNFACAGTIITNNAILSAAHCFRGDLPSQWRARIGSTNASAAALDGDVYAINRILMHPGFGVGREHDIAVLRTSTFITYGPNVASAAIASSTYTIADNSSVTAIGWGRIEEYGPASNNLRAVEVWTVEQAECTRRYAELWSTITPNMVCAGWLDVGGRDTCDGDSGGPLLHGASVVVGITSWGEGCGRARYPGVYTRVSSYTAWIQEAAIA